MHRDHQHQHQQQQQQQQQQQDGFYFYQQHQNSSYNNNNGVSGSGYYGAAPMPPKPQPTYHPGGTRPFFDGADDTYKQQQQQQQPAQTHVMTIGTGDVVTPTRNTTGACPSVFGGISRENSGDGAFFPHRNAALLPSPSLPPPPPPAFQPFQQESLPSSHVTMVNPPAPVFRDNSQQALPAYHHHHHHHHHRHHHHYQQQQQSTLHYHQVPPSPLPPSQSMRSGFMANVLNMLLPQDSLSTDASQGAVPIHQQRFGHPEDDLPLLEELGIVPHHIRSRALAVLNPLKEIVPETVEEMDLAGPVVFAVTLALLLSLRGKLQFSTIYGHSVLGIIFNKVLLTLMTDHSVPLQFVISALGYCLIPSVVLAACQSLLYWLFGYMGKKMLLPALLTVLWSAWCATAMLVKGLSMEKQRYLIMYPVFLFYAVFAALTIF